MLGYVVPFLNTLLGNVFEHGNTGNKGQNNKGQLGLGNTQNKGDASGLCPFQFYTLFSEMIDQLHSSMQAKWATTFLIWTWALILKPRA